MCSVVPDGVVVGRGDMGSHSGRRLAEKRSKTPTSAWQHGRRGTTSGKWAHLEQKDRTNKEYNNLERLQSSVIIRSVTQFQL